MRLDLARQLLEDPLLLAAAASRVAWVQVLFSSTTVSGSTNRVAPDALWSWTIPFSCPFASARIGIT